jgi:hypothetical protein
MIEIESGDVLEMADARFADILAEIRAKEAQMRKAPLFGWTTTALAVLTLLAAPALALPVFIAIWPAYALGAWLDSYQRRTVLYYDLDPEAEAAYSQFAGAFQGLVECHGKWHVAAGGYINDLHTWKRNAGASRIVDRKPTTVAFGLPSILASNVSPPMAQVGRQTIYFLPDVALVIDGKSVGAVGYPDLTLRSEDSNFIETGTVPRDAQVIGQTWKHPNKSGGPDRRFRDNHQIPICRYEVLHLGSASGLNELLEFSRTGVSRPLVDARRAMASLLGRPEGIEPLRLPAAS